MAAIWQPGRVQAELLRRYADCYELLWTGEVGSGKTEPGIMAPVLFKPYRESPDFKALILRHQDSDLNKEIVQRILKPHMYPAYDPNGGFNKNTKIWTLGSKGLVIFTHANNLEAHHGSEYQYAWWDELASFDEVTYCTMVGRFRSSVGLPCRIWSGTNPWGPGRDWIRRRWGPWLYKHYATPRPDDHPDVLRGAATLRRPARHDAQGRLLPPVPFGEVLWYTYDENLNEIWVPAGTPDSLSRCCLFTRTADNERLMAGDPLYKTRMKAVGAINYRKLGQADWDADEAAEGFFQRAWFAILPAAPAGLRWIRRWDFAWTKKKKSDWSVGVKIGTDNAGRYYIGDVVRIKGRPDEVEALVKQTAELDGREVPVVLPIDFSAGIYVEHSFIRLLAGFQVLGVKEKGEKEVRIATLQPQARVGNVALVVGPWNHAFLEEAGYYPKWPHDDQLDAAAGGFLYLVENPAPATAEQLEQMAGYVGEQLQRADRQEGFAVMDGGGAFSLD